MLAKPGAQGGAPSRTGIAETFRDAIALVRNPRAFMELRADIAPSLRSTIVGYVAVLALIPVASTLIGDLLFVSATSSAYAHFVESLVLAYVFDIVSVAIVGLTLWRLAPRFASIADPNKAMMLVSYVYTPVFLVAIVNVVSLFAGILVLAFLLLGSLYGLYILYVGLGIVLRAPASRVFACVIVTAMVMVVVFYVLNLSSFLVLYGLGGF